ncbi:hypothetical protein M8J77_002180 [Diaphorina citri]|nr:hypothetical protein M8J77_002180 [Diaphorina citri]
MAFSFLMNMFKPDSNPNKVVEVRPEKYSDRTVVSRHDCMILYGVQEEEYEIVLHRPWNSSNSSFSLFRTPNLLEAEETFAVMKHKIPVLVKISREMCSLYGLQKLVDVLKEHPAWTIAHIAVQLNLTDALGTTEVFTEMNTVDTMTGQTPLHIAIKNNSFPIVKAITAQKAASLEYLDFEGNSVFHYAAKYAVKDIINVLSAENPKCLNYRNANGYTPLHTACLNDKPDNVKALLRAGADVNVPATLRPKGASSPSDSLGDYVQDNHNKFSIDDMKYGGTPLHWSSSRAVIESLVDMNCDINALDFEGRTALHKMVLNNRLECVVALLSRMADVELVDNSGNTALHLAARGKNPAIVQALIVFGANINALSGEEGMTARHIASSQSSGGVGGGDNVSDRILYILHAVGAARCTLDMPGCGVGCRAGGTWNGTPPPVPIGAKVREVLKLYNCPEVTSDTRGGRLLCLDGGGIRGLILVSILLHLEERVGQPIIHCFDWVAGTSTGAVVALGLAVGKTLQECMCLYFRMKDVAFVGSRPYASEGLENTLKESLGSSNVMSEITHPKIIVTGVLADRKPVELHLFCNYASPSDMIDPNPGPSQYEEPPPPHEQLIWKAARASGAAPSYFRMFGRFIDGGLMSNNPTLDALTEIHEYNLALAALGRHSDVRPVSVVVSIGTGSIPVTDMKGVDVFRPENFTDAMKFVAGISTLGILLVDQATQADGRVVDRAKAWCSMIGVPYFRFSPQLSEDIVMDEKSDEKLVNMLWETKAYMLSNEACVEKLARLLNYPASMDTSGHNGAL